MVADIGFKTGACLTSQIGNSGRLMDALIALLRLKGANDAVRKHIDE